MHQPSLFAQPMCADDGVIARFEASFEGWQREARRLLVAQVPAEQVVWSTEPAHDAKTADASPASVLTVPRRFMALARPASCHSSPDRWALLYRVLWRLTHGERHLLQLAADPDVLTLEAWGKAVRRDAHKMKAFVRFRALASEEGDARFVAWFEPVHHTVPLTADFFRRRFTNMPWSILTPGCCAHYEGKGTVWFTDGVTRDQAAPDDAFEDAWRLYYRSIFNPARVKLAAMRAEMPKKYWKNLPEASDIPLLVRDAAERVARMQAQVIHEADLNCGSRPDNPDQLLHRARDLVAPDSLEHLELVARACRRCTLCEPATQTVCGAGAPDAALMIIGEQPGDREDLAGQPFVGPAGQLLRSALREAGIDVTGVWLTNTVKHFKFRPSGRRRLHARPTGPEIKACLPFVQREIELVNPALVVCLGNTAAQALINPSVRVSRDRGRVLIDHGRAFLPMVHPAALLRMRDKVAADCSYRDFIVDLAFAARYVVDHAPSKHAHDRSD